MKYKILNNASNFYKFSNIQCKQLDINNKLCNSNNINFSIINDVSNYFNNKRNLKFTNNKEEFQKLNNIEEFGENSNISSSDEKSTETDYINIYIYATFAIIILFLIAIVIIELFNKNISLNLFKNKKQNL